MATIGASAIMMRLFREEFRLLMLRTSCNPATILLIAVALILTPDAVRASGAIEQGLLKLATR